MIDGSEGQVLGDEHELPSGPVGCVAHFQYAVAAGGQAGLHLLAVTKTQRRVRGHDGAVGEPVGVAEGDERQVHLRHSAPLLYRSDAGDIQGDRTCIGRPFLPGPVPGTPGLEYQVPAGPECYADAEK
jgi:hypothetical protein